MMRVSGRRTTWQLNGGKRLAVFCFAIMISLMTLVSCSQTGETTTTDIRDLQPEDRFGPENYDADLIVMSFETIEDIGDAVVYRAPSSLETLVARSPEVIVLTIYQEGQAAMHRVQPWMEQLAADRDGEVLAVLASSESSDPFLDAFEDNGWPSFFVIYRSSIELSVYGYSEENHALIMNKISQLLEEN